MKVVAALLGNFLGSSAAPEAKSGANDHGQRSLPVGYPGRGYPSVGYPSVGYPSLGFPSVGYPSAGYPSAGYPSVGYPSVGYPPVRLPVIKYAPGVMDPPPPSATWFAWILSVLREVLDPFHLFSGPQRGYYQ
ncbi:hypothetical protein GE061_017999 [Apolygus lucorum]|uniref:Uncharacterized protein n=1 Tax=Apolygus lucorum TaxID=248454 RepID=A0A8S9XCQ7_APOLU|nr:hypothetical protein GE061_017999 [Apolygus lucorum]